MVAAAVSMVLVVLYGAGSGWLVSSGDAWYRGLDTPSWQPPDVVFGLIWPYNFVAIAAAGLAVSIHGTGNARVVWLVGLAGSVAAALTWAWLFYEQHALSASAVALVVAAVATLPIVAAAFTTRTWAGVLLVPYQVWLALAALLSISYARLN